MRGHSPPVSTLALLSLAAVFSVSAILTAGCGGSSSGGGGVDPIDAFFTASGTPASANSVRMTGTDVSSTLVRVDVVIGGPTTSQDIYSFAFDIVISNTGVTRFQSGSEEFGTALELTGGQTGDVQATQQGSRVIVGVTKLGGGAGNGVGAGEETVVSLNFEILDRGSSTLTFDGSPANPQNPTGDPAALDSQGQVIASITFDAASATVGG